MFMCFGVSTIHTAASALVQRFIETSNLKETFREFCGVLVCFLFFNYMLLSLWNFFYYNVKPLNFIAKIRYLKFRYLLRVDS